MQKPGFCISRWPGFVFAWLCDVLRCVDIFFLYHQLKEIWNYRFCECDVLCRVVLFYVMLWCDVSFCLSVVLVFCYDPFPFCILYIFLLSEFIVLCCLSCYSVLCCDLFLFCFTAICFVSFCFVPCDYLMCCVSCVMMSCNVLKRAVCRAVLCAIAY